MIHIKKENSVIYVLDCWYGFDPAGGKNSTSIILMSDSSEYTFTAYELVVRK